MKPEEYGIMYRVEEAHWWYMGLRAVLDLFWQRHVSGDSSREHRVLDVGCGTGANLVWLSSHARAMGIDFSPQAVGLCRQRGEAETAVASALALPFPDGSFDTAISCDVLCHQSIPDEAIVLREIGRVLKPGGLLLLNLPAYQWIHSSHDVHVQTVRRFTMGSLAPTLKACSFEPLQCSYWNTLLFPGIAAIRIWRKAFPLQVSDLDRVPGPRMSRLLGWLLAVERGVMRHAALPFGLSLFVVARKRSSAPDC